MLSGCGRRKLAWQSGVAIRWAFLVAAAIGTTAAGLFVYLAHTDLASLDVSLADAALGHSFLTASLLVLMGISLPARNT